MEGKASRAKERYSVLMRPPSWPKNQALEAAFMRVHRAIRKKYGGLYKAGPNIFSLYERSNYIVFGNNDLKTDTWSKAHAHKVAARESRVAKRLGRPLTQSEEQQINSLVD